MVAGVRFFEMSACDINRAEASVSVDNNSAEVESLVSRDPLWVWQSIGSDDTDLITVSADFGRLRAFDSLILVEHNLRGFSFDYQNSSGTWVNILRETDNAATTYFAQFSPVTAQAVRLHMMTTQTPDAQKTLGSFIVTRTLGQFIGYPEMKITDAEKPTRKDMISGKPKFVLDVPSAAIAINIKDHVGKEDRDLIDTLRRYPEEFLVWPCGGNEEQFAHADIGWRLKDIFLVTRDKGLAHAFTKNLYFSGMTGSLSLVETA